MTRPISNPALQCVIRQLEERHGSLRKAARALQIDPAYFYRLKIGAKVNPSNAILKKLGLKKIVTYEPHN